MLNEERKRKGRGRGRGGGKATPWGGKATPWGDTKGTGRGACLAWCLQCTCEVAASQLASFARRPAGAPSMVGGGRACMPWSSTLYRCPPPQGSTPSGKRGPRQSAWAKGAREDGVRMLYDASLGPGGGKSRVYWWWPCPAQEAWWLYR